MTIGAAVCCARHSHYQNEGKQVPEFPVKQSLLWCVTVASGASATVACGRLVCGGTTGMRGAAIGKMAAKCAHKRPHC